MNNLDSLEIHKCIQAARRFKYGVRGIRTSNIYFIEHRRAANASDMTGVNEKLLAQLWKHVFVCLVRQLPLVVFLARAYIFIFFLHK